MREIPGHKVIGVRLSPEDKERFTEGAKKDGKKLGTWLKWLANRRLDYQEKTDEYSEDQQ